MKITLENQYNQVCVELNKKDSEISESIDFENSELFTIFAYLIEPALLSQSYCHSTIIDFIIDYGEYLKENRK